MDADVDFFGEVTGSERVVPGPFADRFSKPVVLDLSPLGGRP
jgi:hypothetical protein